MKILVTGGAGFIGSNLIDVLLREGNEIVNIDNFDLFYPRSVKENNIKSHFSFPTYTFFEKDIRNPDDLSAIFNEHTFDVIIHLAAKAGVRPSIADPRGYEETNVKGTVNLLELAKKYAIHKFLFASSSSVYGINTNVPWREDDLDLQPISPYAASKIAAENYGKVYSKLNGINFTALRFFTVYGPRQRPDLAIHKFFDLIYNKRSVPFFGDGSTSRDYTYIDDILKGIIGSLKRPGSGFEVYNLGNSHPHSLKHLVDSITEVTREKPLLDMQPLQEGDVNTTYASIEKSKNTFGYQPEISLEQGLSRFNEWYKNGNK